MTDELEFLLERAAQKQEEKLQDLVPKEIKITKNARLKASPTLGRIVAEEGGSALEWYSLSVARKGDPEFIIRDIILPGDQKVTGAHVAVSGEEIAKITHQLATENKDLYVVGWLHNHGTISTFHSGEDDENMQKVLNSVSLNTEQADYKRFNLIESVPQKSFQDGRIKIQGKDLEDAMIEYSLKHPDKVEALIQKFGIPTNGKPHPQIAMELLNELLEISDFTTREPRITGFCYSIVVNNQNDNPYTEIAVIEEDVLSKKKSTHIRERVPLKVVEVPDDITVDEAALRKEVKQKIEIPKPTVITRVGGWFKGKKRKRGKGRYADEANDYTADVTPVGTGFTPYAGTGAYSGYSKYDEQPDKVSLQELCKLASKELVDYLENYYGSSVNYSKHLDKVVEQLLEERDLRKAFATAGELEKDKSAGKPGVLGEEDLEACVYCSLYYPLKKMPDKAVIQFLIDCASEDTDIDEVIKKHAPVLANPETPRESFEAKKYALFEENPVIENFVKRIISYCATEKKSVGYSYWIADKLCDYSKNGCDLSEALLEEGWPEINKEFSYVSWLSDSEKRRIKQKSRKEKSPETLAFMRDFTEAHGNIGCEQVLEEYITKKTIVRERKSGQNIDNLLGNNEPVAQNPHEFADALVLYTATDKHGEYELMYGQWMTGVVRAYLGGQSSLEESLKQAGRPVINHKAQEKIEPLTKEAAALLRTKVAQEKASQEFAEFKQDFSQAVDLYIDGKPATPSAVLRMYARQYAPAKPAVDDLLEAKK